MRFGLWGYSHHPETLRWKDRLKALFGRPEALVIEMSHRGYRHRSPLAKREATGSAKQTVYVDRPRAQVVILRSKGCRCDVEERFVNLTAPVMTKDLIAQHSLMNGKCQKIVESSEYDPNLMWRP